MHAESINVVVAAFALSIMVQRKGTHAVVRSEPKESSASKVKDRSR